MVESIGCDDNVTNVQFTENGSLFAIYGQKVGTSRGLTMLLGFCGFLFFLCGVVFCGETLESVVIDIDSKPSYGTLRQQPDIPNLFGELPGDVQDIIISHVPIEDLLILWPLVSKTWYRIIAESLPKLTKERMLTHRAVEMIYINLLLKSPRVTHVLGEREQLLRKLEQLYRQLRRPIYTTLPRRVYEHSDLWSRLMFAVAERDKNLISVCELLKSRPAMQCYVTLLFAVNILIAISFILAKASPFLYIFPGLMIFGGILCEGLICCKNTFLCKC